MSAGEGVLAGAAARRSAARPSAASSGVTPRDSASSKIAAHGVADRGDPAHDLVAAAELLGFEVEVDHAARVHDEVGCVQDAAPREPLGTGVIGERVVRRAAHRAGVERIDDLVGQEPADAGRDEHVRRNQVLLARGDPCGAELEREVALGRG